MAKRMLFIGAGAIGSYLGSFLARAGHDVVLVDPWPEQVETVRRRGIAVTGPHDPFEASPPRCTCTSCSAWAPTSTSRSSR